jgi:hypothetical protein
LKEDKMKKKLWGFVILAFLVSITLTGCPETTRKLKQVGRIQGKILDKLEQLIDDAVPPKYERPPVLQYYPDDRRPTVW